MLLTKNGMLLKCTQAYCHNNGTYETPVAMTTGYIRYIHLWFPLILSVKVVYSIIIILSKMALIDHELLYRPRMIMPA